MWELCHQSSGSRRVGLILGGSFDVVVVVAAAAGVVVVGLFMSCVLF